MFRPYDGYNNNNKFMYIIQFTSFLDSLQATKTTEQLQSFKKRGIRKMDREHKRKGKFGN